MAFFGKAENLTVDDPSKDKLIVSSNLIVNKYNQYLFFIYEKVCTLVKIEKN